MDSPCDQTLLSVSLLAVGKCLPAGALHWMRPCMSGVRRRACVFLQSGGRLSRSSSTKGLTPHAAWSGKRRSTAPKASLQLREDGSDSQGQ